jgi:hypothetical protein
VLNFNLNGLLRSLISQVNFIEQTSFGVDLRLLLFRCGLNYLIDDYRLWPLRLVDLLDDKFDFVGPDILQSVLVFTHVGNKISQHISVGFHHHALNKSRNCAWIHSHCVSTFHCRHNTIFILYRFEVQVIESCFPDCVFSNASDILLLNSFVAD